MTGPAYPSTYLELYLEAFQAFLDRSNVTDIYVNRPGEMWIELLGGGIERHEVESLTEGSLWRLAKQVAGLSHQGINREHPLLAATLPDGARIQVVARPATRGPIALAIRRHAAKGLTLADYTSGQAARASTGAHRQVTTNWENSTNELADAVARRLNIVVCGGTSSGKTTLLNALLAEVPLDERLIVIEDTPELQLRHANSVGLVAVRGAQGEARVTPDDLLQAALRMRPDRIILGELRGPEAFTFLRAINTGHPGSLTTIHADSPTSALDQLALMILLSGHALLFSEARQLVERMIDLIVWVDRRSSGSPIRKICRAPFH